jgi:murein tripeptide amidase MpaA
MIQKSNYILKLSAIMLLLSGLVSCKKSNDHADNTQLLTIFELTNGTESASYEEGMWWWKQLDEAFDEVNILEMGNTDDGEPLSLVLIDHKGATKIEPLPKRKKNIIFINNGIHPGEPDGIDASMLLARNILTNDTLRELLNNNTLAIIPYYNIGGAKNRGRKSRANQEGPLEYGFRGNSQNLDLNRDFIKNDSRNAQSFV